MDANNINIIYAIIAGILILVTLFIYYSRISQKDKRFTKIIIACLSIIISTSTMFIADIIIGNNILFDFSTNKDEPIPMETIVPQLTNPIPEITESPSPDDDSNNPQKHENKIIFIVWVTIPLLTGVTGIVICFLLMKFERTKKNEIVKTIIIPLIFVFMVPLILYSLKLCLIDHTTIYHELTNQSPTDPPNVEETSDPTEMPTVEPIMTEKSNDKPPTEMVNNPEYTIYSNSEYKFSISYPSHFNDYDDGGTATLYTASSPSGSAREIISAQPVESETVNSSLDDYIADHAGEIQNKTLGDDYYTVRINDGDREYYKCCKFKNGNMYWFEFISLKQDHNIYDLYINDINNSFIIR